MDRIILHADMNSFYASVECMEHPEWRDKPLAVCGDEELRHGIVLAKNQAAKAYGVSTGDAIWQAKTKCPDLLVRPVAFEKYFRISALARQIYAEYTDRVEPYGPDECWLDLTGCARIVSSGRLAADEIRKRIRRELGLTVSVGVSYNKIFAKFGSDYKSRTPPPRSRRTTTRQSSGPRPARTCSASAPPRAQNSFGAVYGPSGAWRRCLGPS